VPRAAILAPALVAALLLSACTDDDAAPDAAGATSTAAPNIIQGAAPGEANTTLTAMPESEPQVPTEADVAFVHMMLPHHAQALEMTAMVPDRTSRSDVPLFAERIELSQQDEIELMVRWLEKHELPVPEGFGEEPSGHDGHADTGGGDDHGHDGAMMPGLLTAEQLEQLGAAEGEEFDRLFLQFMYYHHDGALQMVEDLLASDGAQETELFQLVTHIDSDQRIEMDRITGMLAEMSATPTGVG
jgi:uncharacterized protein (DUF305 family)